MTSKQEIQTLFEEMGIVLGDPPAGEYLPSKAILDLYNIVHSHEYDMDFSFNIRMDSSGEKRLVVLNYATTRITRLYSPVLTDSQFTQLLLKWDWISTK